MTTHLPKDSMETLLHQKDPILLVGEGRLTASVAACLLKAGHELDVYSPSAEELCLLIDDDLRSLQKHGGLREGLPTYTPYSDIPKDGKYKLVIALTEEDLYVKQNLISRLGECLNKDVIIAINSESFTLNELQKSRISNELIGLNWTEPAHTTFFLEIISGNDRRIAEQVKLLARSYWGKDPYIVIDSGIRSLLMSAMAREASYLVDSGFASVEDIDRACRNDAGYYLPFAGNCRYMDLMGTSAYGMVMKDLNPDLSKNQELPQVMESILSNGGNGMEIGSGFYKYSKEEAENWKRTIVEFSYQIQKIIEKYPFNANKTPYTD